MAYNEANLLSIKCSGLYLHAFAIRIERINFKPDICGRTHPVMKGRMAAEIVFSYFCELLRILAESLLLAPGTTVVRTLARTVVVRGFEERR